MWNEFKKFVMRGNVVDLAVGIIIGAAFTAIVQSLVNDIIMPPIGYILGDIDFSRIVITLQEATADQEAVVIRIGAFINAVIYFILVALAVFFVVKAVNTLQEQVAKDKDKPAPEPTEKDCPYCFTKIPIKATRCPHCTSELS
ncbi:MAG: large conductance mechanosensitive channel protein MscL [Phototrophicales bacterium]|nr:MAG: large conductance mechanosensitive channel protein MscL [Phototrophicales bacterium]RMG75679.1 MAG: large-conductance mechanosensitive channel protein MscL [Chloroflexota bacterium]